MHLEAAGRAPHQRQSSVSPCPTASATGTTEEVICSQIVSPGPGSPSCSPWPGVPPPHEQHLLEEIRTLTATTHLAQTRLLEVLAEHCRPVAVPLQPSEVRPVAGDRL